MHFFARGPDPRVPIMRLKALTYETPCKSSSVLNSYSTAKVFCINGTGASSAATAQLGMTILT